MSTTAGAHKRPRKGRHRNKTHPNLIYSVYGIWDHRPVEGGRELVRVGVTTNWGKRYSQYQRYHNYAPTLALPRYVGAVIAEFPDKDAAQDFRTRMVHAHQPRFNRYVGTNKAVRDMQRSLCQRWGLQGSDYDGYLYVNNTKYREEYNAMQRARKAAIAHNKQVMTDNPTTPATGPRTPQEAVTAPLVLHPVSA